MFSVDCTEAKTLLQAHIHWLEMGVDKTWGRPWCRPFNVRTVSPTSVLCCFGGHCLISINLLIEKGIEGQNGGYRIYSIKRPTLNKRPPRISAHPLDRKI